MNETIIRAALAAVLAMGGAAGAGEAIDSALRGEAHGAETAAASPARAIAATAGPALEGILIELLERNPELAALAAEARAAAQRAPQVRALPDPVASLTAYLLTPETRVGPQLASVGLSQKLPWFGKLPLREQAALAAAAAAGAKVEARRLELVTEARRLTYELAFLAADEREVETDRATLAHYEELARARYASGVGLEQGVVKIQAEITRDETRLLEIATRSAALGARLNALRDRPEGTRVASFELPPLRPPELSVETLRESALASRPELAEVDALIEQAGLLIELAKKEYRPDLTAGLRYTLVGRRDDRAGRLSPPEDDGRDVLGLFAGVNLPIWKKKLAAGVEETVERRLAAEQRRRAVVARIEGDLDDLVDRLRLTRGRIGLLERVLRAQAEQSLRSAEAAYVAGTLNALDLLDAERVLLEVRVATERARTDYAVALAELEGVIGAPLTALGGEETTK